MNDENLAILIENIIRAVRSCAEPFFVPVTNETEYLTCGRNRFPEGRLEKKINR